MSSKSFLILAVTNQHAPKNLRLKTEVFWCVLSFITARGNSNGAFVAHDQFQNSDQNTGAKNAEQQPTDAEVRSLRRDSNQLGNKAANDGTNQTNDDVGNCAHLRVGSHNHGSNPSNKRAGQNDDNPGKHFSFLLYISNRGSGEFLTTEFRKKQLLCRINHEKSKGKAKLRQRSRWVKNESEFQGETYSQYGL
jgi:hypothetical protein